MPQHVDKKKTPHPKVQVPNTSQHIGQQAHKTNNNSIINNSIITKQIMDAHYDFAGAG
jgi:hypothetical protein